MDLFTLTPLKVEQPSKISPTIQLNFKTIEECPIPDMRLAEIELTKVLQEIH